MNTTPEFRHRGARHSYNYSDHYIEYLVGDTKYEVIITETDAGDCSLYIRTDNENNVLPPPPFQAEAIEWFLKSTYRIPC